ncbi:hypothetical protein GCM10022225_83250 [Plantactinospora mayteni]|uniref:N-acetyltransferase domain-containing protein n=1 Tax=Plantactinospora mayteni TaxID=566021 RepID=A0ABQ4F4G3_9ACTN|nr:GNAT family N-acetyltransferase [Plantactinospora mayteni]GIH01801.1 hypothetical protein Pma05_83730 [Plantactinospora mayteni]
MSVVNPVRSAVILIAVAGVVAAVAPLVLDQISDPGLPSAVRNRLTAEQDAKREADRRHSYNPAMSLGNSADPLLITRGLQVPPTIDAVTGVYADAYSSMLNFPAYSVERFVQRLRFQQAEATFDIVQAQAKGTLVGFAFGNTLTREAHWWDDLEPAEDQEPDVDLDQPMFLLRQLAVMREHRRRGVGRRLHDAILADRGEPRASLLVRPNNPARRLYLKWGWQTVGHLQPYPDAPRFEALVLDLAS